MKHRPLTRLAQVRIFDAAGGICGICGLKIHAERGEKFEIDHAKPLWLGGEDVEANMRPLHKQCHGEKTRGEAPVRAKGTRVRANHLGIRKSRTPIQGWRRFDGTVVHNPRLKRSG